MDYFYKNPCQETFDRLDEQLKITVNLHKMTVGEYNIIIRGLRDELKKATKQ